MSMNDLLISELPVKIFEHLVSPRRVAENGGVVDAAELRRRILAKLQGSSSPSFNAKTNSIVTVRQLFKLSSPILLRILDPCLTYVECNTLLSRIYQECAARPVSALKLLHQKNQDGDVSPLERLFLGGCIPSGLPTLDLHLKGGIGVGTLTEVVGRAGVGKTQLAQQLCVLAAQSGYGGSIYIDSEKKMSLVRLKEIAIGRIPSGRKRRIDEAAGNDRTDQAVSNNREKIINEVLENVTVHSLFTTRELSDTLERLEKEIVHRNFEAEKQDAKGHSSITSILGESEKRNSIKTDSFKRLPVRLIIIDSIAAPIRRDFDLASPSSSFASKRASTIFQIARKLKQLADNFQLAIVVINQVGSGRDKMTNMNGNHKLDINAGEFTASLGTAWQYCVSTRIVLEHIEDPHKLQRNKNQGETKSFNERESDSRFTRTATIAKSNVSKNARLEFELTSFGLCEVSK